MNTVDASDQMLLVNFSSACNTKQRKQFLTIAKLKRLLLKEIQPKVESAEC